jgi:hypothetical protein
MRFVVICALAGCGPAMPGTVAPLQAAPTAELAMITPLLPVGEQLSWTVTWMEVAVGQLDLNVTERGAHSSFVTGTLARALVDLRFELATVFDRSGPRSVTESMVRRGKPEHVAATIAGTSYRIGTAAPKFAPGDQRIHTLHTALGIVRAWSKHEVTDSAYLWLLHRGELYRLDVFPPRKDAAGDRAALRVDATVRALDRSSELDVSIWLAPSPDRTPLQIVIRSGEDVVSAELDAH